MLDPVLNLAIFIICWWLAFFAMLPIGVRGVDTAEAARGHDAGAPERPMLRKKALWAAGVALVLWALTALVIAFDPFQVRP